MITKNIKLALFFLASTFIMLPLVSFSAIDGTIILNPKNPEPYSPIKLTLTSYSFNVNTANITWSSKNKKILSGLGEKSLNLRTGGVGEEISIDVIAETADGSIFEASIVVVPASVDILFETPESNVPLFYEGRSLPGEGARVKFTAMPSMSENGIAVPKNNLSYSWYLNDTYAENASGAGKQTATFNLEYLTESTSVKVKVSSPSSLTAEKEITIYPHDVLPLLYTYDDVLGINYGRSLEKRFETRKDFTLALEPYFLSTGGSLGQSASYLWLLDGLPITPLGGILLSLNPKKDSFGSRFLSIEIENSKRRLQKAKTTLDIVFDTRK